STEVVVGGVWRAVVDRDWDPALPRVFGLLLPRHAPLPRGRDHRQMRGEGRRAQVESDLVVPFAGAPVRYESGSLLLRDRDEVLADQGSCEGGAQGILAFGHRARLERRADELHREL